MDKVHYSSASDEWETSQEFFDELNREFNFEVDLCAQADNAKCGIFSSDIESYLTNVTNSCRSHWMNPPYSRGLQKKCIAAAKRIGDMLGKFVVCLLPSRTDTQAWHEYIWDKKLHKPRKGVEIRFLQGRFKFEINGKPILDKSGKPQPAPFPSVIVIFNGEIKREL